MNDSIETSPGQVRDTGSRTVWLVGGVLAIASLAAAAGVGLRSYGARAPTAQEAPLHESLAAGESVVSARVGTPVPPIGAAAPVAPAAPRPHKARPATPEPMPAPQARAEAPRVAVAQPVDVCRDCGVVESVRAVTRKGEAKGVGAVAGGVVGALLGNQVGKGDGRKAMTVLGAVGGGFAGHEVEKRARSVTVHEVRVRLDDGSVRTIEQASAPAVGERVIVQGNRLKPAGAPRVERQAASGGTAV